MGRVDGQVHSSPGGDKARLRVVGLAGTLGSQLGPGFDLDPASQMPVFKKTWRQGVMMEVGVQGSKFGSFLYFLPTQVMMIQQFLSPASWQPRAVRYKVSNVLWKMYCGDENDEESPTCMFVTEYVRACVRRAVLQKNVSRSCWVLGSVRATQASRLSSWSYPTAGGADQE